MSGICFTELDRSALPIMDQKMKTVIANTDDANFLAFPTISATGRSEMVDQCIAFDRPDSINFTHATCIYLPNTFDFNDRSKITVYKTSNDVFAISSSSKMSYYTESSDNWDTGDHIDYLWIAPAGLASATRRLEFPEKYSTSSWCSANNGTNGICMQGNTLYMQSDYYYYSVGARYPHDNPGSSTTKLTSYVTTNYFIDMVHNNGAHYSGPIEILSSVGSNNETGFANDSFGIINSGTNPSWDSIDTKLLANPSLSVVQQYTDRPVFTNSSSYSDLYAYAKTDMYYKQSSGYIYAYMPYMCIKLTNFNYDPNYPNASLTFGLQYNALMYGVADDPVNGYYGMIYDNDEFNRTAIRKDASIFPTQDYVYLFNTNDFDVYAFSYTHSVSICLTSTTGNNIIADILKQGYVQTSSTGYTGDMDRTVYRHGETIGSNKYLVFTYTQYDLDTNVQTFTDVTVTYNDKVLRFNVIKTPGSSAMGNKKLIFHIIRDG